MDRLNKIFKNLPISEPRRNLRAAVLLSVDVSRRRQTLTLRISGFAFSAASIIALVPAIQNTFDQAVQSGFFAYVSAFVADSGAVFTVWQEFLLSLVESIPVLGLTLIGALICLLFYSIKKMDTSYLNKFKLSY